jgi:hypothetical protein
MVIPAPACPDDDGHPICEEANGYDSSLTVVPPQIFEFDLSNR